MLEILVFLHFPSQIGGVEVTFVGGEFQLLVDPSFGLVAVSLELLQFVGVFQQGSSVRRFFFEGWSSLQQLAKGERKMTVKYAVEFSSVFFRQMAPYGWRA